VSSPCKVGPDVYAIGGPDITSSSDCCVYAIDAGDIILVDTGCGGSYEQLITNLCKCDLDPRKLKTVIATHAHIDHIGALAEFKRKHHVNIIAHELDAPAIESGVRTGAEVYGVDYTPCHVDIRIKGDGEKLSFKRHDIHLMHIPGHTPGSLAVYLDAGQRVLFGQDVHGPYMPEWGGDIEKAQCSLQKLLELNADILCEGHFGIYQPAEAVHQYISGYIHRLQGGARS